MESALLKATRMFSSCVELALLIGVSPQKLDNWLNKPVNIPLHYAIAIEAATERKVTWDQLVEPEVKDVMTHAQVLSKGAAYAIPCLEVAIDKIKLPDNYGKSACFDSNRPICIDENNQLIYGLNLLEACKKQGKNKIFARRLSFVHLLKGHYGKTIENVFLVMERTSIGIELESRLGNRQGQRTDLGKNKEKDNVAKELVKKFSQVAIKKGEKTRTLVSKLLCFKNFTTYKQAKTVLQYGCTELITQVDQKKISISKAAKLAKLPHQEQINHWHH